MPSAKNTKALQKAQELLKNGKAYYFTNFVGFTVQRLESLRRELKKSQGNYLVIKNTLARLVMKELGIEQKAMEEIFVGPTGIAVAYEDPIVLAKILKEQADIKIKGGFVEGIFYNPEAIAALARIPSRSVLYAEIVGSLNIVGRFVDLLRGTLINLIWTIEALKERQTNNKTRPEGKQETESSSG